jgi:PAS domain S-box-containing protein
MVNRSYKGRILVVDDNPDLSEFIKQELANHNYYVKTAQNAKKAIKICHNDNFDIGVIDYKLINYTGIELIEDLEKVIPGMDYIVVTGQASLDSAIEAFQHEKILYYEDKPINFDRLITFINQRIKKIRAEEALRESEERYRLIVENAHDGIEITQNDRIIFFNEQFAKMLGYQKEELKNIKFSEIFTKEALQELKKRNQKRQKGIELPPIYETTLKRKDDKIINVEVSYEIIDYHGQPATFAIIRDITDLKQTQKEKEQLQNKLLERKKLEAIGSLGGGIAHDYNNKLAVIQGRAEIALTEINNNNPAYEHLQEILKTSKEAAKLTRQILVFSRRQELFTRDLNINQLIKELHSDLLKIVNDNINLKMELSQEINNIVADRDQLERVLINLITNAAEAISGEGTITIRTKDITFERKQKRSRPTLFPSKDVLLEVEDNGSGIKEEHKDRIFDPFFTTKGMAQKSGMGLSVVLGIIKKHKGRIEVDSEIGNGTIIKIYLPAKIEGKNEKSIERFKKQINNEGSGETLLLVEDDPLVIKYLENTLAQKNYNILPAETGQRARSIFKKYKDKISILLTDAILPDVNGIELIEEFKEQKKDLKVILSSGFSRKKALSSKTTDDDYRFIQKPYGIKELLQIMQDLLQ